MLELVHVSKAYEQKPLLRDISFRVDAGETVCLLGASGSGKSTLLRMIAGLDVPEGGTILFGGMDLAPIPAHLRDFGLVFQDYGLFPHLNVFDNVAFGLKMRNLPRDKTEARVGEMLGLVNLWGFEKRKVTDLSGGEQQRAALARALAPQPRLLMFDEPLGALDRALKEDLLNELRKILRRTKIPAVYVTHDQEEAFAIADRILLLHDGSIIRAGAPAEVWAHPRSFHAARMLGIGNVIEGRAQADGKVATALGALDAGCRHGHTPGQTVFLLIKQSAEAGALELQVKAADALFTRDGFEVRCENGLTFRLKDKPRIGALIQIKVTAECLG